MFERKNIEEKYKWDLSAIYASEPAFYSDYEKAELLIKNFRRFEGTMTKSAEKLCEAISAYVEIDGIVSRLWQYASLNFSLDTSNNKYQALTERVRSLAVSAGEASWFFSPYILKLDRELVESWFSEYPPLTEYRRVIEKNYARKALYAFG